MNPERRAQILRNLATVKCADELQGFREGLEERGEHNDTEVLRAVQDRGAGVVRDDSRK